MNLQASVFTSDVIYLGFATAFSRMFRRRVPILRFGSRGPTGDQKSLHLCSQAFAIVRKRSQSSARVRGCSRNRKSRNAELSCHFWTCRLSARLKSVNPHRDRGAPGRETQSCRHCWTCRLVVASRKGQPSQGSGGSWS